MYYVCVELCGSRGYPRLIFILSEHIQSGCGDVQQIHIKLSQEIIFWQSWTFLASAI